MISKFKLKKKQKNKKKKGFTLIELLAVIVILAVIMVITIPTVIGSMNNAKLKAEEIFIASIEKSLNDFIEKELQYSDYTFEEPKKEYVTEDIANKYRVAKVKINEEGTKKNISFKLFDELGFYPENDLINPRTDEKCLVDTEIEIYKNKSKNEYYYYTKLDCVDYEFNTLPTPEEPDLSGGIIPIIYDETKGSDTHWFVADPTSEWYNYDNQEWANGVIVSQSSYSAKYFIDNKFQYGTEISSTDWKAMFVWIPRFSYTIGCADLNTDGNVNYNVTTDYQATNPTAQVSTECLGYRVNGANKVSLSNPGAIDIKFILSNQKDEYKTYPRYEYDVDTNGYPTNNRKPDKWLTHPAFSWDGKEISGFWFGKFETSGNKSAPAILPNKASLSLDVKYAIDASNNVFNNTDNYFENKPLFDMHITKNSEWAAVAYLSQSIYGKYGNDNYTLSYKEIKQNESTTAGKNYNNKDNGYALSTTGNIYGIYDMSGGYNEIVMGNYNYQVGNHSNSSGMKTWLQKDINYKYFDIYSSNSTHNDIKYNSEIYLTLVGKTKRFLITTIGHGLYETKSWYNDKHIPKTDFGNSGYAWLYKGGDITNNKFVGIFNTILGKGDSGGFRITYMPY